MTAKTLPLHLQGGPREVRTETIAGILGDAVGGDRRHNEAFIDIFVEEATRLGFRTPLDITLPDLGRQCLRAFRDYVTTANNLHLSSEAQIAALVIETMLNNHYGPAIHVTCGWLPGETLLNLDRFTLTGRTCPACGAPEAHGMSGGVRCVNVKTCGWWYCA